MTGKVYLVGAGPGDSKLITLRAVELLKKADVVLYDRLVSKKILSMIPKSAEKIYVGRAVGDDTTHQITTNDLMVKYAKSKKNVVRLKGGDPIIFGRGGEEAEFLKENKEKYEKYPLYKSHSEYGFVEPDKYTTPERFSRGTFTNICCP